MNTCLVLLTLANVCFMPPMSFEPGIELLIDSDQPISEREIRSFEQKIGFTLPDDYRAFLLLRNGGWYCHGEVCPLKEWRRYGRSKVVAIENLDSLTTGDSGLEYGRENFGQLPPHMLVIGTAAMGDGLVIPLTGKRSGAILLFDHEGPGSWEERLYLIADSFATFMRAIESRPDVTESIPLFQAAQSADMATLHRLLDEGESLDIRNNRGETLLMCASGWRQPRVVEFLLKRGASVHVRDTSEKTALIHGAIGGSVDCVQLLLKAGADINAQDNGGESALTASIRQVGGGRVPIILIEYGADIRVQTKCGESPISLAKYADLKVLLKQRLSESE